MFSADICHALSNPYLWIIAILLETVPPILICILVYRSSSKDPWGWIWVTIVFHSNFSLWAWVAFFVSHNACINSFEECRSVGFTGAVFLGISILICLVAALNNDQSFPEARLRLREAKMFMCHLQQTDTIHSVFLKQPWAGREGQRIVKKDYPCSHWSDDESDYPDVVGLTHQYGGELSLKVRLVTSSADQASEDDFQVFLNRFIMENGGDEVLEQNIKIISSVPGRRGLRTTDNVGMFPTIRTDKTCRIHIHSDALNEKSLYMDCFLRTAWIFNILALSGPVLYMFMCLKQKTVSCSLVRRFHCLPRSPPSIGVSASPETSSARGHVIPPARPCSREHVVLFSNIGLAGRGGRVEPLVELEEDQDQDRIELPPSYSALDLTHELPTYDEAVKD